MQFPRATAYHTVVRVLDHLDRTADALSREPQDLADALNLPLNQLQQQLHCWAGITVEQWIDGYCRMRTEFHNAPETTPSQRRSGTAPPPQQCAQVTLHATSPATDASVPCEIRYGIVDSPFGVCLLALSNHGICHLSLYDTAQEIDVQAAIGQIFPKATITATDKPLKTIAASIFANSAHPTAPLQLQLNGSPFQLRVWRTLCNVPSGQRISYSELANRVGVPGAARAVGSAVAGNEIAFLVPCHRIVLKSGKTGDFRWGAPRKRAIQYWENCHKS